MWQPLELAYGGRRPATKRIYEYRVVNNEFAEIRITTEKDMVTTLVDLDIVDKLKENVSQMYILRNTNNQPYVHVNVLGVGKEPLSRYVLESDKRKVVDHINGDTLDNRRVNLRAVSHGVNLRNRRFSHVCESGYRGVRKEGDKWRATIHIGTFDSPEEAFKAYREAYEKLFPGMLMQE